MKRKLLLLAVVVICCATLGFGSVAFFTANATAQNVITSGEIEIALNEWTLADNGERMPYPRETVPVMPGTEVSKIVELENVAAYDAWVRMSVVCTVLDADGEAVDWPSGMILLNGITSDWVKKDGYYYLKTPLAGGAKAELFTSVSFDAVLMDDAFQDCTVTVSVGAEALQVKNIPLESDGLPSPALYPVA